MFVRERNSAPSPLTSALAGKIVVPDHARFDEARRAWNLAWVGGQCVRGGLLRARARAAAGHRPSGRPHA
jgi:hypothetical protein